MPDSEHLNPHQRDTLVRIFEHPVGHNIEWPDVVSLLEAVGSVDQRHDGSHVVHVGTEEEVLTRPEHKGLDAQQVLDLRRMLTGAGYLALVRELQSRGKEV